MDYHHHWVYRLVKVCGYLDGSKDRTINVLIPGFTVKLKTRLFKRELMYYLKRILKKVHYMIYDKKKQEQSVLNHMDHMETRTMYGNHY